MILLAMKTKASGSHDYKGIFQYAKQYGSALMNEIIAVLDENNIVYEKNNTSTEIIISDASLENIKDLIEHKMSGVMKEHQINNIVSVVDLDKTVVIRLKYA